MINQIIFMFHPFDIIENRLATGWGVWKSGKGGLPQPVVKRLSYPSREPSTAHQSHRLIYSFYTILLIFTTVDNVNVFLYINRLELVSSYTQLYGQVVDSLAAHVADCPGLQLHDAGDKCPGRFVRFE